MKKSLWLRIGIVLTVALLCLPSCLDEDGEHTAFPTALVTVKPNQDNSSFYLQLNDSVALQPVNMKASPFGKKEVRALVRYTAAPRSETSAAHPVVVHWIDSILTKTTAKNFGKINATLYGNDPVEIVNDWVTLAEDGYLTLRFRTRWSGGTRHLVNLVPTPTSTDPYRVEFYHNAYGDLNGRVGDGLVAFRLDSLPDTQGKTVDLTLQWQSYSGVKTATFKYRTRKTTAARTNIAEGTFVNTIQ